MHKTLSTWCMFQQEKLDDCIKKLALDDVEEDYLQYDI